MTRRRLSTGRRLAFGLAVPLVLLTLAEVAVRVVDPAPPGQLIAAPLDHVFDARSDPCYRRHPRLFWELVPHLDRPLNRYGDRTDGLGLRNPETPGPKRPGTTRVLCLGDSCTYGLGVRSEDAWPSRLRSVEGLDVVNAGVTGYSSYQGLLLFDEKLSDLAPDVVVVEYGINDVAPWPIPIGDIWAYLTDRERAAHLAYDPRPYGSALIGWLAGHVALPTAERVHSAAPMAERVEVRPRVPLDEFEANVRELAGLAPRAIIVSWAFRVHVAAAWRGVADPEAVDHPGTQKLRAYRAVMRKIAADMGVPHVDVAELFIESGLSPEELFIDEVHTTPRAAQIVADAVAAALAR